MIAKNTSWHSGENKIRLRCEYLYGYKILKRAMSVYKFFHFFIFIFVILLPSHGMAEELVFYVGKVYPFTIVDQDGLVSGAAVDVVSEIMEKTGNPIDVSKFKVISWARAVEETETHEGTAIFCMARTPPERTQIQVGRPHR